MIRWIAVSFFGGVNIVLRYCDIWCYEDMIDSLPGSEVFEVGMRGCWPRMRFPEFTRIGKLPVETIGYEPVIRRIIRSRITITHHDDRVRFRQ